MSRVRLDRLLSNLGYCSRREVAVCLREGWVRSVDGRPLKPDSAVSHDEILFDDEALDPPQGLLLMLHKPVGHTCSSKDPGRLVYDLLPGRFRHRSPVLATVGRLDRETSGLLLLTDDGQLLHRIISPRSQLPKVYDVTLAEDLRGDEFDLFASGTLLLDGESTPLLPVELQVHAPRQASLTLHEGRYHQVRRMFAAIGNHVTALHRQRIGGMVLGDLPVGAWRALNAAETQTLWNTAQPTV